MVAYDLPLQVTPFISREAELAKIAQLLDNPTCRLLTLVGPGGIGKTRLALQASADQIPHFAQGVHFVPLSPIRLPNLLASAIAIFVLVAFSEPVRVMLFQGDILKAEINRLKR